MPARFNQEEIRDFWARQAAEHGQSPSASWSDHRVIEMEIREILKWLSDGDHILDVGCANGFSTLQFALERTAHIRGVDFIPDMIAEARRRLQTCLGRLPGNIEFVEGDVTALAEPAETYNKVVSIRVIINLGSWERQRKALLECVRVLKPGGLLLLSEATLQGWRRLNQFRREWCLADIPMPPFNQYLDENRVIKALSAELELIDLVNFASTYYVGTRVLKPLLSQALGGNVDATDPGMEWNRWFSELPAWGDYGTQKLFVLRKR